MCDVKICYANLSYSFCLRALNHHGGGDADGPNKKRKLNNVHSDGDVVALEGTKVLALPSGPVTCNSILSKHIDTVKPFIRELVEHANLVSMNIVLNY